jgi:hypothetical protein
MTHARLRHYQRGALERDDDRRARHARGHRTGLGVHAAAFAGGQALIASVWAVNGGLAGEMQPWFVYPLIGWGVGLAAHYAAVRERIKDVPTECQVSSTGAGG